MTTPLPCWTEVTPACVYTTLPFSWTSLDSPPFPTPRPTVFGMRLQSSGGHAYGAAAISKLESRDGDKLLDHTSKLESRDGDKLLDHTSCGVCPSEACEEQDDGCVCVEWDKWLRVCGMGQMVACVWNGTNDCLCVEWDK
eukprot:78823-Chlamydomonas_euryale.AAC.3